MTTKTLSIEWSETPVAGATVHLSDGVLGYWATVPATWTEQQVRAAFLETADYDATPRIDVTLREGNEHAPCFAKCGPTLEQAVVETAKRDAAEAVREGATAPWGDGETLPDVGDLLRVASVRPFRAAIEQDRDLRREVVKMYDVAFRSAIDATAPKAVR